MLMHRILSALVGIPILILAVWLGGWYLAGVVLILAIAASVEFSKMVQGLGISTWLPGMIFGVVLFIISALIPQLKVGLVFTIILWVFLFRTIKGSRFGVKDASLLLLGTIYVGWLMSHLVLLREIHNGFYYVILVFVATWMTDTMAYFVGLKFGRHKLAPSVSPKKTVEGSLGGVAGSILGSIVFAYLSAGMPLVHFAVMGVLVGILGQVGDLAESAMKRLAGIKDSGNIIPGHGGVLDRFDSLLFTAPLVYYYVQLFIID